MIKHYLKIKNTFTNHDAEKNKKKTATAKFLLKLTTLAVTAISAFGSSGIYAVWCKKSLNHIFKCTK